MNGQRTYSIYKRDKICTQKLNSNYQKDTIMFLIAHSRNGQRYISSACNQLNISIWKIFNIFLSFFFLCIWACFETYSKQSILRPFFSSLLLKNLGNIITELFWYRLKFFFNVFILVLFECLNFCHNELDRKKSHFMATSCFTHGLEKG